MVELGHLGWFGHVVRIGDERYSKITWQTRTQRKELYPASVVMLLVLRNMGGMGTTGKIRQIEVTENNLFY
jgi:hypothetical protein